LFEGDVSIFRRWLMNTPLENEPKVREALAEPK
jgi:hypothetical protein